ncbi:TPA: hypothetical protein IAA86_00715 [Candidatus Galligastranaerophilus intestinavium]|uniref:Uncharacterized protein n=1 Tax=Candidatus Galligastranaerophilus intestinavium TaxID=2840836 RepID=A0A9D1JXC8_9BACT|nr:hypothetical protein [Candidatus Galligastranaerophilus intestinavium]
MEQFIAQKEIQNDTQKRAKEYLMHYLGELKLHFNLEDKDIIKILKNSYFELTRESIVQRWMCVIKSFLHHK